MDETATYRVERQSYSVALNLSFLESWQTRETCAPAPDDRPGADSASREDRFGDRNAGRRTPEGGIDELKLDLVLAGADFPGPSLRRTLPTCFWGDGRSALQAGGPVLFAARC